MAEEEEKYQVQEDMLTIAGLGKCQFEGSLKWPLSVRRVFEYNSPVLYHNCWMEVNISGLIYE